VVGPAAISLPEELFGKYELIAKVATGGMAEIFRASSNSIGGFQKIVALKRILPHLSKDAEFVSLFIAEAKLAVALNHSNIVQVLDFGKVDQSHYIAMEYVEGKDLTQILIKQSRNRKQIPVEVACYIIAATARGLEYAHARKDRDGSPLGIVHRDVSPHNILVSFNGEVKLTDFGIAKAKNHVTLSRPGVVLGKFAYMSPEQARGDAIDTRTDIYAAGITLYETLTGRRLFYCDDPVQTLAKVRNPRVPLPSKYNEAITPELDMLVMKALAPDVRDRFQTARELSTALTMYLARTRPDFTDFDLASFMVELFPEIDKSKVPLPRSASADSRVGASVPMPSQIIPLVKVRTPGNVAMRLVSDGVTEPSAPARMPLLPPESPIDARETVKPIPRSETAPTINPSNLRDNQDREAQIRAVLERFSTAPSSVHEDPMEAETLAPGKLTLTPPSAAQDPVLVSLTTRLLQEPNLWLVAELGQRLLELGQKDDGIRALRVAAMKFAQNGLLVQALALYVELLDVTARSPQTFREIAALAALAGRSSRAVLELAGPLTSDSLGRLLESLILGAEPSRVAGMMTAPLFSFLSPDELARFAGLLRLRKIPPATTIVDEGQRGQSLFVIARGRVIIYCKNYQAERVYLSSLSDGDCFGEFSFFTGEPRAATVETADEVLLFEIAQQDFDRVIDEFPTLTRSLLQLYKERVVATLLAKSEVFGVLPQRARLSLLERFESEQFPRDTRIIKEGEKDETFYMVKSGEVEVYTERNGYVLLSKLKAGDFFGEIAAITGGVRTASVRTLCPVEVLRLSAHQLRALLDANVEMARILEKRIKQREAETALRLTAGGFLI